MKTEPTGAYVYQPIAPENGGPDRRIYGVGGVGAFAKIIGLTKKEADAIVETLKQLEEG